MRRAAVAGLVLAVVAPTGCLSGGAGAQAWAAEHIDAVETLEVRIGNTTYTLDPALEPDRALALETLGALHQAEAPQKQAAYRSPVLDEVVNESAWVHVGFAFQVTLDPPAARQDALIVEDVRAVWEAPPERELAGDLLIGDGEAGATWATGHDVDQLRDLSVEVLHTHGRAGG